MNLLHLLFILGLGTSVSALSPGQPHHYAKRQSTGTPCASLKAPSVLGATVLSVQAVERRNFTLPGRPGDRRPASRPLSFCDVNVTLTHGNSNDRVRIEVWLPLATTWNGRFQGTGGGGWVPGTFGAALAPAVAGGYAAASTDAGLVAATFDGSQANFTPQLFENFARLSVHEMAVVGKAMATAFYGRKPDFSYWNGCSTGGRQGYMEAQSFPTDFDGILAAAPAINWDKFVPAESWPFVVQTVQGGFIPSCVFNGLIAGTIAACDGADGAMDGLISDPTMCQFDARGMVGQSVLCGNGSTTAITSQHATIYNTILQGPRSPNGTQLWFGILPGTNPSLIAAKTPFSLSSSWLNNFVTNKSNFTTSSALSIQSYATLFSQSVTQFASLLGTSNPDLSAFKAAGGKLLTWHGLGDPIIFPQGTFDYLSRVQALMGGTDAVDDFYRVFAAPGVAHCAGGTGPEPDSPLDVLVQWVEGGVAPETLPATKRIGNGTVVTRDLCRWPTTLRYMGSGDVNEAASWTCGRSVNGTEGSGGAGTGTGAGTAVSPAMSDAFSGRTMDIGLCWVAATLTVGLLLMGL